MGSDVYFQSALFSLFIKARPQAVTLSSDILSFIALGTSNREIAERLFISVNTVETHRKKIKAKLDIVSPYELLQYANAFNLI